MAWRYGPVERRLRQDTNWLGIRCWETAATRSTQGRVNDKYRSEAAAPMLELILGMEDGESRQPDGRIGYGHLDILFQKPSASLGRTMSCVGSDGLCQLVGPHR
jgi:hypothetical protein